MAKPNKLMLFKVKDLMIKLSKEDIGPQSPPRCAGFACDTGCTCTCSSTNCGDCTGGCTCTRCTQGCSIAEDIGLEKKAALALYRKLEKRLAGALSCVQAERRRTEARGKSKRVDSHRRRRPHKS